MWMDDPPDDGGNDNGMKPQLVEEYSWQKQHRSRRPPSRAPRRSARAAEAEVDALVKKGLKALDEFEKLDQKQVDRIGRQGVRRGPDKHLVSQKMAGR